APARAAGTGRQRLGLRFRPPAPPHLTRRRDRPGPPGGVADRRAAPAAVAGPAGRSVRCQPLPPKARQSGAAGAERGGPEARLPPPPRPAVARLPPRPGPPPGRPGRPGTDRASVDGTGTLRRRAWSGASAADAP